MNGFDLLKDVTKRITNYTVKNKEKQKDPEQVKTKSRKISVDRWFGIIPLAVKYYLKNSKSRK